MRGSNAPEQKISEREPLFPDVSSGFFVSFLVRKKGARMKNGNDAQEAWYEQQANYFNIACGFYELELLEEAEAELDKIDRSAAVDAVPVLALRLNICYRRKQWNKMAALATQLFLLDQSNPRWPYAHGFAMAKIDSEQN